MMRYVDWRSFGQFYNAIVWMLDFDLFTALHHKILSSPCKMFSVLVHAVTFVSFNELSASYDTLQCSFSTLLLSVCFRSALTGFLLSKKTALISRPSFNVIRRIICDNVCDVTFRLSSLLPKQNRCHCFIPHSSCFSNPNFCVLYC